MYRAALVVSLALAACSEPEAKGAGSGGMPPAPVVVTTAAPGNLTDGWRFLGQVEPSLQADIAAAVAGHVKSVAAREGDKVEKNQVLITLDRAQASAQLQAARAREAGLAAELVIAEKQLARIAPLEYPTVSEAERERFELTVANLKAQLAAQKADVQRLSVSVGNHTVRAPFAGTVQARHVDPGAWVSVGQPMLDLVSLDELEVHVDVSSELGGRLAPEQKAVLKGPTEVPAVIAGVVAALDSATRTMRIRLRPQERPPWLIAGMPIDVEFQVELSGEGVTLPRDALVRGPVSSRVVKFVDGAGEPVTVEVIASAGDQVLVKGEGLAVGDEVVIRGNERLRPGQPLRKVE
jgi:RND family efflux transporter MFP subunit